MCKKTALTLAMVSIIFLLVLAMGNAWAELKLGDEAPGCIFRRNVATDSDSRWPPIPRQDGHLFRSIVATHSDPNWPPFRG